MRVEVEALVILKLTATPRAPEAQLPDRRLEDRLRPERNDVLLGLPPFFSSAIRDQLVDIVRAKVGRQKGRDRETDATLGKCYQ